MDDTRHTIARSPSSMAPLRGGGAPTATWTTLGTPSLDHHLQWPRYAGGGAPTATWTTLGAPSLDHRLQWPRYAGGCADSHSDDARRTVARSPSSMGPPRGGGHAARTSLRRRSARHRSSSARASTCVRDSGTRTAVRSVVQDVDERQRVDPGTIHPKRPVQMRAGDPAGRPGVTDHLTARYQIPFLDEHR